MSQEKLNIVPIKAHLTLDERISIQTGLIKGDTPYSIAKYLGKSPSTITREINNHSIIEPRQGNDCMFKKHCQERNACEGKCNHKLCKHCSRKKCYEHCQDYVPAECDILAKSPHVCNACPKLYTCTYEKRIYKAKSAQAIYEGQLRSKRVGHDITDEQMEYINKVVSPMLKRGLSPYHIKATLGDELDLSVSTLYRMIDNCELDARNIDLREQVKRKPRRKKRHISKDAYAIITEEKRGHLWSDYERFKEENDDFMLVEMDCVEGKKTDHACLLTLDWKAFHMQLAFIMDNQDMDNVVATLDKIEIALDGMGLRFADYLPVIVTDNGHEFCSPNLIERSCIHEGEKRTKVFYCEPNRSEQKGSCENAHKRIRYIIPKGTSLEPFTQEDITYMMNNINSYRYKSIGGSCGYEIAMGAFPKDFFIALGCEQLSDRGIELKPELFIHRNIG